MVVYSGVCNVAASDMHTDAIRCMFDTTMHRSVASRADDADIELPENPSRELLTTGAGHDPDTCVRCHGAPGRDPADWSRGMRPEPPHLVEAAAEWRAQEIY